MEYGVSRRVIGLTPASYGVSEQPRPEMDATARLVEEVLFRGFAVKEGVISSGQVQLFSERLDRVYREQCEEVGDESVLTAISDRDIARCPLAYDDVFLELCQLPGLLDVPKALLGESVVLLMQNGIINRPDRFQVQTKWHRDLNYQHWTSSRPLAVGALLALEDFDAETGGTVFLPSSQKFEKFPSAELIQLAEVQPSAPAGSVIFFDAMVYHRAGVNSSHKVRRAINHVIGSPILAQQVSIPSMLHRDPPTDPWLAGYLGYRWAPSNSVADWRLQKFRQRN